MNNLNSVLLEGEIWDKCKFLEENGKCMASTIVKCERAVRNKEEEISFMTVIGYDNYALLMLDKCKIGRKVRIVGRLKQFFHKSDDGVHVNLVIVVEHIEFKKEFSKEV